MLLLSIYLIGFAAMFVWQWRQPEGLPREGHKLDVAFAVALIWPILVPIIFIKYLGTLAGYDL